MAIGDFREVFKQSDAGYFHQFKRFIRAGFDRERGFYYNQDRYYHVGEFITPTLKEKKQELKKLAFELRRRDSQPKHFKASNIEADSNQIALNGLGGVHQAAGQFNCLEHANQDMNPEHGADIYQHDLTQGPAVARSAYIATVYRNYWVLHKDGIVVPEGTPGAIEGQTNDQQINCLVDIQKLLLVKAREFGIDLHSLDQQVEVTIEDENGNRSKKTWHINDNNFFVVKNGYVDSTTKNLNLLNQLLTRGGDQLKEQIKDALRVGIHRNVEITNDPRSTYDLPNLVTQLYASALSIAYSSASFRSWEPLAKIILEAAYEHTIIEGLRNNAQRISDGLKPQPIYLTLLGGGFFGNDPVWIRDAISSAIEKAGEYNIPFDIQLVHYRHNPFYDQSFLDQAITKANKKRNQALQKPVEELLGLSEVFSPRPDQSPRSVESDSPPPPPPARVGLVRDMRGQDEGVAMARGGSLFERARGLLPIGPDAVRIEARRDPESLSPAPQGTEPSLTEFENNKRILFNSLMTLGVIYSNPGNFSQYYFQATDTKKNSEFKAFLQTQDISFAEGRGANEDIKSIILPSYQINKILHALKLKKINEVENNIKLQRDKLTNKPNEAVVAVINDKITHQSDFLRAINADSKVVYRYQTSESSYVNDFITRLRSNYQINKQIAPDSFPFFVDLSVSDIKTMNFIDDLKKSYPSFPRVEVDKLLNFSPNCRPAEILLSVNNDLSSQEKYNISFARPNNDLTYDLRFVNLAQKNDFIKELDELYGIKKTSEHSENVVSLTSLELAKIKFIQKSKQQFEKLKEIATHPSRLSILIDGQSNNFRDLNSSSNLEFRLYIHNDKPKAENLCQEINRENNINLSVKTMHNNPNMYYIALSAKQVNFILRTREFKQSARFSERLVGGGFLAPRR